MLEKLIQWVRPKRYYNLTTALQSPEKAKQLILSCSDEDLNTYSGSFIKLINLEILEISTPIIHPPRLPKEIGELQRLKKLSIVNVLFEEFPEWITKLHNLEYLRVRGCEITTLPDSITNLTRLKELRIENCELSAIPSLVKLTNLTRLSLIITPITSLDSSYLPPSLKVLDVSFTPFCQDKSKLERLIKDLPKTKILYPLR